MNPLARIIDANFNRAREALRTMEDLARFALDDAALAAACKDLRHELTDAIHALKPHGLDRGTLLASRDTPGDVGTHISTPQEHDRPSLAAIAAAAGSRLSEALRSIEEAAKAAGADARPFEQLRYAAYTLDQRLALALPPRKPPQWRLCVLITESLCTHHSWLDVAAAALRAGADCLQLREKNLDDGELLVRARTLVNMAGKEGDRALKSGVGPSSLTAHRSSFTPAVIINDRPDIALLAGADGVHLGQADLPILEARGLAGFRLLIGVSTTNLEQARAAVRAGADYCGLGPMFPTTTRHKPRISGPAYLRDYLADPILAQIPHLAIGGITPANLPELREFNCRGIAVSSCVCNSRDPESVCRELLCGIAPL